ncbi:MAG: GntP family permease, partial [Burkholderiales bacterium]|nr:GntP family permease [Burkholderiales bacterium]
MALGITGIIVSLALLIFLAYRGWNVIMIAPFCAAVALLFSWGESPLLATYTQIFMPALGTYFAKFFPLFMLGAIFGKLMDDSGSARAIAHKIVGWVGKDRSMLAVVLACALLTYGGVSLFVVAFSVYPIAVSLFREAEIPKRFIPACIGLGSFTFTMTALPGTPAIQNAIPIPFFGTNSFAAPGLGIIASIWMFAFGMLWLNRRVASAKAKGEGYGEHKEEIAAVDESHLPSFVVALIPILLVLGLNYVFTAYVFPAIDTSYLATD